MGYYVNITDSSVKINKENLPKAYEAMCELNKQDDLKRGGSHLVRHFSWMDEDYPNKCANFEELMNMIGFDVHYDAHGNVISLGYDNKTGQESLFLESIAPWMENKSYIVWRGEDDSIWVQVFANGAMLEEYIDLDRVISSVVDNARAQLVRNSDTKEGK